MRQTCNRKIKISAEIIARFPNLSFLLCIRHQTPLIPKLGDQTSDIGLRIIHPLDHIKHLFIKEDHSLLTLVRCSDSDSHDIIL